MTETKPIEVVRRSRISELLGKPKRANATTVKSTANEEDYQSVNCTLMASPREGLQPTSMINSTVIKPFSQSLLIEQMTTPQLKQPNIRLPRQVSKELAVDPIVTPVLRQKSK